MSTARRKRQVQPGGVASAAAVASAVAPAGSPSIAVSDRQGADTYGIALAVAAWVLWFMAHLHSASVDLFTASWVAAGLAVGVWRPWLGLILTLATVPFLGGAVDQPVGEALRAVPVYGAAVRVLVDRAIGRGRPTDPPWWITILAVVAGALYVWTFFTFLPLVGGTMADLPYAGWLIGGPAAGMATWVVASHAAAGRQDEVADVVLVVTVVAVLVALADWAGLPGVSVLSFPPDIGGRLGALGFPTPTGMGLAIALPFAFAAGWRRHWLLGLGVAALIVTAIVLTGSRGPLLAVAAGGVAAVLVKRRLSWRLVAAMAAAGAVMVGAYALFRYGRDPSNALATMLAQVAGDTDRVASWGAGIAIVLQNPIMGGGWHALSTHGYADLASRNTIQSHNLFLHAFSEGGFLLGIAFGGVVLYSAFLAWRNRHVTAAFVIAAVVTYVVCGLWDFPQVRAYGAVMGGLVLGLAAVRVPRGRDGTTTLIAG